MLDGPDQVGRAEGVVDDQGQAVRVGDGRDGVDVGDVGVGVAQGLQVHGLGVGPDGGLHLLQVVGVDEGGLHPEVGQGLAQQVVAAAVDGLLGHDVVALLGQGLDGVGDGRRAGGHRQGRGAALQGRHTLFQHLLGGVGQPAVDVAALGQAEAGLRLGRVAEYIGGGLVDGHRPGVGGGVGLLLAHVELQCLEFVFAHFYILFSFIFMIRFREELSPPLHLCERFGVFTRFTFVRSGNWPGPAFQTSSFYLLQDLNL